MPDCLLCEIGSGKKPSYTLWENDDFKVFLDIYPKRTGHTLVIPKKHYDYFTSMPAEAFVSLMKTVHAVSRKLQALTGAERIFLKIVGLHFNHTHIHLIPESFKSGQGKSLQEQFQLLSMEI